MCKAKAGLVVTQVTQKAVELLGPLGYSRELLLEKWMRDAKINDIFEGTQQINQLIIARRILGYSSEELSLGRGASCDPCRPCWISRRAGSRPDYREFFTARGAARASRARWRARVPGARRASRRSARRPRDGRSSC